MGTGSRQKGGASVELALLLVPLLVLLLGIEEFGRAMYQYNTIVKATRDATRFLSTRAAGGGVPPEDWQKARCLAVFGNTDCAGNPLAPGLAVDRVQICDAVSCPATHSGAPTGSGAVNLVTVSVVGYQFDALFNFSNGTFGMAGNGIVFGPIATTMRQVL